MPEPLYIVTAVSLLGVIVWAFSAFFRPEPAPPPAHVAAKPPSPKPAAAPLVVRTPAPEPGVAPAPAPSQDALPEDDPTGPNALILVTAVGRTDPGLKRSHNEDAYAILEDQKLFVIADGMGKHAAGEVASQLCVDAITEAFRKREPVVAIEPPLPQRAARLRAAIVAANRRVLGAASDNDAYSGMGTTVVAAYFSPSNQRVYIAHVGDSRCYRLRAGELHQLTMDHTLGAAGITGKTAALLSRAVGAEESVDVDMLIESPLPGDIYLLCSDGLSRMVSDELIQATLETVTDLEDVTRVLIAKANEQGGRDNITTILVRVDSPAALG